eukprot:6189403-Pleurochrysis_carterae.AAC.1
MGKILLVLKLPEPADPAAVGVSNVGDKDLLVPVSLERRDTARKCHNQEGCPTHITSPRSRFGRKHSPFRLLTRLLYDINRSLPLNLLGKLIRLMITLVLNGHLRLELLLSHLHQEQALDCFKRKPMGHACGGDEYIEQRRSFRLRRHDVNSRTKATVRA